MVRLTIELSEATHAALSRDAAAAGRTVEQEVAQRLDAEPAVPPASPIDLARVPDPSLDAEASRREHQEWLEEFFRFADEHAFVRSEPMPTREELNDRFRGRDG